MSNIKDFTKGNATKQILLFSLPMLIGNVFQQLYSMADAVIVGRLVGGDALAAVGASASLLAFFLAMLIGLTTGASVVISQLFGAGQEERLKRTVSTSILFLAGLGLILSALGVAFAAPLMRLMNTPQEVFGDAVWYFSICMGGCIFQMIYNVYSAYLRALGDAKTPLVFLILASLLNIGLDILFVGPLNMKVAGAALATVLAQGLSGLACYLYARKKVPLLHITKWVFDKQLFKLILRYSIPAAVQFSLTSLASLTIVRLVNGFGSSAVAGYTAAIKIDQFATMPLSNISLAISTFAGQNMGAGQEQRAKQGLKSGLIAMVGVGIVLSLVIFAFGNTLVRLFVDSADASFNEIVRIGHEYLSIMAYIYTLFAIFFAFNGFFRGVGDATIVMVLTIVSLTLRAVSAHLLVAYANMGPEAVAWSIMVGWALCGAIAFFYYKKRLWAGKAAVATK